MFLPLLGGGSQGKGSEGLGLPGGGLKARRKGPPAAPAPGRKGLSYPGPQPILSDFPQPTNLSQTLLQPALKNPPTLPPPLSLPNIVKMADAGPALRSELPQPFVNPPEIKPAEPPAPKPEPKPPEPPSPPATLAMPTPVDKLVLVQPANIPKIGLLPEKVFPEPIPSLKPSPPDPLPQRSSTNRKALPRRNCPLCRPVETTPTTFWRCRPPLRFATSPLRCQSGRHAGDLPFPLSRILAPPNRNLVRNSQVPLRLPGSAATRERRTGPRRPGVARRLPATVAVERAPAPARVQVQEQDRDLAAALARA
jgi:hypothetical protein